MKKRIKLYKEIKIMFKEYIEGVCSKKYKESIDKLNQEFDLIITDLLTLFDKKYIDNFQRLYNIIILNLIKMISNENKTEQTRELMSKVNKILENKPIGYSVSIPVPDKLDEIEWDVNKEIYKYEQELIEYINLKSGALKK